MDQIKIGPTGWGSVIRKTAIESLGDVTVNVNSRGGVEVIRKAGDRDYRGWYAEASAGSDFALGTLAVEGVGRTASHVFRAAIDVSGKACVDRSSGNIADRLGFDLVTPPDYRGETTRELEEDRRAFLRHT